MIVVDVETTGLDPKIYSIVSIGALDFQNPKNQFYGECRIFKGARIDQKALEVNGFSEEEVKAKKKPLKELLGEFISWAESVADKTLAGENVFWDRNFLEVSAKRYRTCPKWLKKHRIVDLHSLSYTSHLQRKRPITLKDKGSGLDLDTTLKYVGLKPREGPHNALDDAKLEAEALSRILFGKSLLSEFEHLPVPDYLRSRT